MMKNWRCTLASVTAAKVRIMPRPAATSVLVIHFNDLIQSVEATGTVLAAKPSAVEMVDDQIINAARHAKEFEGRLPFLQGQPEAILIAEFYGDTAEEVADKVAKLEADLRREKVAYACSAAVNAGE